MRNQRWIISDEERRICANLEQQFDVWMLATRELDLLEGTFHWRSVGGRDYLYRKARDFPNGQSQGVRSAATERLYTEFEQEKARARVDEAERAIVLAQTIRQYRSLRLPQLQPLPGRILRELEIAEVLGSDFIVVGTNAFPAYEILAGERFAHGLDETEDFDLGWCRGGEISLATLVPDGVRATGSPLLNTLRRVDPSFRMHPRKSYQALNGAGYEVELLTAPSSHSRLSPDDDFNPIPLLEQEWLLQGRAVRQVVATRDGKAAAIVAPDPRYMALHKLWLADKPGRKATKREKDRQQGDLLLEATTRLIPEHPVNVDFILGLPEELLPVFNAWASRHAYIPPKAAHSRMR